MELSEELKAAAWRKATRSASNGGDRVEVAPLSGGPGRPDTENHQWREKGR
jgi:hypothetical protein